MKLTLVLLSVLLSVATYAQTLTGKIIDQQNQPVPFANVIALDADSVFINGNVSGEDGMFRIEATEQAALLKVSYIGFEEQIIPIQEGKTDMGIIKLSDSNLSLSEITVIGHKPLVSMEKGVLTTGVANSLLSSLGTAEDVLKHIPGLDAKDDKYTVLGKGEAVIYIDNRKVQDIWLQKIF